VFEHLGKFGKWIVRDVIINPLVSLMTVVATPMANVVTSAINTIDAIKHPQKNILVGEGRKIVGLKEPRLVTSPGTFTQTKFDTTTYPDRALITITNGTGNPITCTGISIQGKCVIQFDGGYQWDYKDYSDIELNGESTTEVSNKFIIDAEQVESIGDYVRKELAPHSMYRLHIPGCHFEYEIGDTWHITLSYTISGQPSEAELIDTDVEIIRTSTSKTNGGVGETLVEVRVPSGVWSKTLSRRARLISAGLASWLNNRGNIITVAASDWTGQADYFCDGTDDDVQIQAAIDATASGGGGVIQLTRGIFSLDNYVSLKSNVKLVGMGANTILKRQNTTYIYCLRANAITNCKVSDIVLDGNSPTLTYTPAGVDATMFLCENSSEVIMQNCIAQNLSMADTAGAQIRLYGFVGAYQAIGCIAKDISGANSGTAGAVYVSAFYLCDRLHGCIANNITATSIAGGVAYPRGFHFCKFGQSCSSLTITASGGTMNRGMGYFGCENITNCNTVNVASNSYGFYSCVSMQQCKSTSNATHYTTCYADAASLHAVADDANGGYNS